MKVTWTACLSSRSSFTQAPLLSLFNLIIPSDVLLDVLDKDISPGHRDKAQCQPSWTYPHSRPEYPTGEHIWRNRAKMAVLHGLIGLE